MEAPPNAYKRYYQRNREELTRKMREKYDATAKHEYYEANKEHIKEKMKEIYQRNKAERLKQMVETARANATDEASRAFLAKVLHTESYKGMGVKAVRALTEVAK